MFRASKKAYYDSESFADFKKLQSDLRSAPSADGFMLGKESKAEANKGNILLYCAKKAPNKMFRKEKYLVRVKSGYFGAARMLITARRNLALSDQHREMTRESVPGPWKFVNIFHNELKEEAHSYVLNKPLTSGSMVSATNLVEEAASAEAKEKAEAEKAQRVLEGVKKDRPSRKTLFKRDGARPQSPGSRRKMISPSFYSIRKNSKFWVRRQFLVKKNRKLFDKELLGRLNAAQADMSKTQTRLTLAERVIPDPVESSASSFVVFVGGDFISNSERSFEGAPMTGLQNDREQSVDSLSESLV